jgi:hypothetical protein
MSHPKKHYPSISAAARESGVTRATLKRWRDVENIDVLDPQALAARQGLKQLRADSRTVDPVTSPAAAESYGEARRRRAVADANRAEVLAAQAAGSVIDLNEAISLFQRIALELKGRLMALRGELVPELEGQSPAQMHRLLDERFRDLLDAIHDRRPIPPSSNHE